MPEEFDPQAPLVGSDCLQYANFAARLKGAPIDNVRNGNVITYRRIKYTEGAIKAYAEAFDKEALRYGHKTCPPASHAFSESHLAGINAAKETGGFCPPAVRKSREALDRDDAADALKYGIAVAHAYAAQETLSAGAGAGLPRTFAAPFAALRKAP